jgi:PIN domain nuclease of toxin-antitoxin system
VIVLDTHAWLWWQAEPRRLSRAASRAIDGADRIGVCSISIFELGDLETQGRIRLLEPLRRWIADALADPRVAVLPVTHAVALDAAQLRFAGDPFDRIVYATARSEAARLITRDERLRRFDRDLTLW